MTSDPKQRSRVITDGRFSGATRGLMVGHVSPEAAVGGPIAALHEGDSIVFDIEARRIDVELSDAEIATRLVNWTEPAPRYTSSVFAKYADWFLQPQKEPSHDHHYNLLPLAGARFLTEGVTMPDTIGFIGLGIMGRPMAHNLLKAGFPLVVHNRHQEVTDEFVATGALSGARPREIAAACDVLITMLPGSAQVEEVLLGPDGVSEGAHAGLVVIDMSTISPIVARTLAARLAEHGIAMLDAPVSGGDTGAIAGTLSIMVGGDEDTFKHCMPIFQAFCKAIPRQN